MAIFHAAPGRGRIINLVLQDAKGVWVRADKGVAVLEGQLAERFRKVAHLYGYVEQDAPEQAKQQLESDAADLLKRALDKKSGK